MTAVPVAGRAPMLPLGVTLAVIGSVCSRGLRGGRTFHAIGTGTNDIN